ncbi:AAA family ATPase [Alkalimarinus sediminis]|uniref:AAA family ATPase n=1 Tax=Alkalimarinus sediminis TaxID=1632866 RepID=A0A9E8KPV5_9ALTE|nr:AAA family ATPase [Alkalimarinus sediminis]UZW73927.1 AAA family ATPase [Alkalimarinus sediminis]
MNAAVTEHDRNLSLNDQLRDKYQLKTEPFSEATHLFFQGAQRQHNLETLRHLVSYGDMVLLLTGEAGSGKTTLLAELSKHIADGVRMVSLKPSLIASPRKLAHELCKRLDMQQIEGEPVTRTMERVLETCAHNAASGDRLLLVVDDAHKTNRDSFKVLLSTFRGLGGDSGICLLVSGRPEILQSITCEGVDPATCSWIHQIHLKPFSKEDAETYVSLRLIKAGSKVEPEFSDNQRKALYELGKGCPGRINRIAPGVLLDAFEMPQPKTNTPRGFSGLLVGVVVSLLLSFAVIGYQYNLFFSSSDSEVANNGSQETSDESPADNADSRGVTLTEDQKVSTLDRESLLEKIKQAEEKVSELPAVDVEVAQAEVERDDSQSITVSPPVVNVAGEAIYSSEGVIQPSSVVSASRDEIDAAESTIKEDEEGPAVSTKPEQTLKESEKILVQPIKKESGKGADKQVVVDQSLVDQSPARHPRFRDDQWVSSQQKGAYTIQVLGSRNEQTAIKYIESVRTTTELVYIESLYKEKPWYVVVFGVYANKAQARAKMDKLPASVKKQKPWIRSIEGL